jgi:hypothetical protein
VPHQYPHKHIRVSRRQRSGHLKTLLGQQGSSIPRRHSLSPFATNTYFGLLRCLSLAPLIILLTIFQYSKRTRTYLYPLALPLKRSNTVHWNVTRISPLIARTPRSGTGTSCMLFFLFSLLSLSLFISGLSDSQARSKSHYTI